VKTRQSIGGSGEGGQSVVKLVIVGADLYILDGERRLLLVDEQRPKPR
jgi:hypothetical protein